MYNFSLRSKKNRPFDTFNLLISERILLVIVILLGLFLRLYQLGRNSLWNDEVHVALAAVQPTIMGAVNVFRHNPMPMPLDYLVAWWVARFSLSEAVLRLPPAIWGTLTLPVCYALFRKLSDVKVALLGTLLLALSPLHIHYSQELRFYAALLFFYYLSTFLLLEAIDKSNYKNWALFLVVSLIGLYFHVFVILTLVNGIIWLGLTRLRGERDRKRLIIFIISAIILSLALLPAYIYLESGKTYGWPLLLHNPSLFKEISYGLGWIILPYNTSTILGKWFGFVNLFFGVIGILYSLSKTNSYLFGFTISSILQVPIIIFLAALVKFPFIYRQVLFLHPAMFLYTSIGCLLFCKLIASKIHSGIQPGNDKLALKARHRLSRWIQILIIGTLLSTSVPAITDYYSWPKSEVRGIINHVSSVWKPNMPILVAPGYQERVFRYYLQFVYKENDIAASIIPINLSRLQNTSTEAEYFLIYFTSTPDVDNEIVPIKDAGFHPILFSHTNHWLGQPMLFQKRN